MNKIVIIDYGIGNVYSIAQALLKVTSKVEIKISGDYKIIRLADKIILPGQGAILNCIKFLKKKKLYEEIINFSVKRPLLGICVGEQMLFDKSEENSSNGLKILSGKVIKFQLKNSFKFDDSKFKIPQIGWNMVKQTCNHPLWKNIEQNSYFYFVHSYYVKPNNIFNTVGKTIYGNNFTCAIANENIFATQFHPEKSSISGLQLYKNFISWNP